MGRLVGLSILAVWLSAALFVAANRADLFGSGNISANIGSLTAIVIVAVLLGFTLREIAKTWPEVMEQRRRRSGK